MRGESGERNQKIAQCSVAYASIINTPGPQLEYIEDERKTVGTTLQAAMIEI